MKIGICDVGSNSVRLMIWADGKTVYKKISTTRLGEGLAFSRRVKEEALVRTLNALAAFYREAKEYPVDKFYAFATAAVRSAENGEEFVRRAKETCGVEVDVVSGEEEAALAVSGVLAGEDGGIVDIGGGSTEVCFVKGGNATFSVSMNIGAVRLFDACGNDPALLKEWVEKGLAPLDGVTCDLPLYAVGGTATTIAALKLRMKEYDGSLVQGCTLTREELGFWADELLRLSVEERKKLVGMDARRAEIIGGASLLLFMLVQKLNVPKITVSDRDNLEGYLQRKVLQ